MKSILYTGIISLLISVMGFSQEQSYNTNIWLQYVGKFKFSPKFSSTIEGSMRYANGFSEKQQFYIRPSLDYQIDKNFSASVGVSYFYTYVYGNPSLVRINTPEKQAWVLVGYLAHIKKLKINNRLRQEFRFTGVAEKNSQGELEIDHYDYRTRLRYSLLFIHPIFDKTFNGKLTAFIGDELFLNIGSYSGKTTINQNRFTFGLGYAINPHNQIQVAFVEQTIINFPNTLQENNATFRIAYLTNLDLFKKKK